MITNLTTAKPYAKAIFNLALRNQQLLEWQHLLKMLTIVALECKKRKLLINPQINSEQKIDFFSDVINKSPEATNLVALLAMRKKLALLPDISSVYQALLLAHNKILEVKIISAYELTITQKEQFLTALQQRYKCEISLQCLIDTKLIGGAVVYIADKVIDGSIKGLLQNLKHNLLFKD